MVPNLEQPAREQYVRIYAVVIVHPNPSLIKFLVISKRS